MKLLKKIRNFWGNQDTLAKQLFSLIIIIGTGITISSTIITIIEGLGVFAVITSTLCTVLMVTLLIASTKVKNQHICYVLMCYLLNCILLPITFFSCGGLESGMILYYLTSIFLCTPYLKGKERLVTFFISMFMLVGSIILSILFPNIVAPLTVRQSHIDIVVSFILTSICIYAIGCQIVSAYEKEKSKTETLLKKIDAISQKDELTNLYNRRVLFRYLQNVVISNPKGYYIAMFDIDNFKRVNDNYGHLFGDKVLSTISKSMLAISKKTSQEMMARYGGEEFVYVIYSNSPEQAYDKIELIRKNISQLTWQEDLNLTVTISGGFIICKDYPDINSMIKNADDLLYIAKKSGKNMICK